MFESYLLTTDGKEYIDVCSVREALGIVDEYVDIFGVIKKLKEERDGLKAELELTNRLYKENRNFVDKVCEAVDIQRPYLESGYANAVRLITGFKRERDELKEKCDKLKLRVNAAYGASCGYSEYSGDKAPAFLCDVISYNWNFGALDTPFSNQSIRVELNLTPTANYKGTFDMEDLRHYIQEYGRERKLGIIKSVDYKIAKAARAELKRLYKTVLGIKDTRDIDLSPREIAKEILDEYERREEFLRALSCSLGFGDPVVNPNNIDQKEKDILERVEGLKSGVWPCENSSTFAEHLRNEFPKFCERYNVTPLTRPCSIHDWMQYTFERLVEYRDLANNNYRKAEGFRKEKRAVEDSLAELRAKVRELYKEVFKYDWEESQSYVLSLNDIKKEYKRVVHNFEERTADWHKAQQELDRYKLAVGSLLGIPKEARDDINAIERSFNLTNKKYVSLKEFRNDVCEILDIPSSMADDQEQILKEIHDFADRYYELRDFRADICGILNLDGLLGTPKQNDKYILEQVEKLKNDGCKPTVFRNDVAIAIGMTTKDSNPDIIKRVMEIRESHDRLARLRSNICTALCLGHEDCDGNIIGRIHMMQDCHEKLCKDYAKLHDDYISSQKQVKGWTNRCDSLEDLHRDLWEFRRNAIEDLKSRGFCFRPEENETLPEIYGKLLKRYDWAYGEYKEQYRLRQMWHVRWESENERANGEHKRAEKLLAEGSALKNQVELLTIAKDAKANELVALQAFKNECRKLKEEKTKVISALGQDIWDDCLK